MIEKEEVKDIIVEIRTMYVILQSFNEQYLGTKNKVPAADVDKTLLLLQEDLDTITEVGEEQMMVLDGCIGVCYGFCDSCVKKFEELCAAKNEKWMKEVEKKCGGEWGDMVEVEKRFYLDMGNAKQVLDQISERVDKLSV